MKSRTVVLALANRLLGPVGELVRWISIKLERRERERSARLAFKTAELILSSAPADSPIMASAIRAMLRHSEQVDATHLPSLLTTLQETLQTIEEPMLRQQVRQVLERHKVPVIVSRDMPRPGLQNDNQS